MTFAPFRGKCPVCHCGGTMVGGDTLKNLENAQLVANLTTQLIEAAAKIERLDRQNRQLLSLVGRANRQIYAWADAYGRHNPEWLPPAGDVRLLEDISEAIDAALSAADAKGEKNGPASR